MLQKFGLFSCDVMESVIVLIENIPTVQAGHSCMPVSVVQLDFQHLYLWDRFVSNILGTCTIFKDT